MSCVVSECFKQIVSKRLFCFDEESEQRREETREKDPRSKENAITCRLNSKLVCKPYIGRDLTEQKHPNLREVQLFVPTVFYSNGSRESGYYWLELFSQLKVTCEA